jgi:outer membrane protein TolC
VGNLAARSRYKAAKVQREQVELQFEQIEQQVLVEIADAVRLAESSLERVAATREARLFAEAALQAEQTKLENGKSTSFFVLQFQRDLTAARLEEIRALAEYNNALAQLAFSEGTTLERREIDLDLK